MEKITVFWNPQSQGTESGACRSLVWLPSEPWPLDALRGLENMYSDYCCHQQAVIIEKLDSIQK